MRMPPRPRRDPKVKEVAPAKVQEPEQGCLRSRSMVEGAGDRKEVEIRPGPPSYLALGVARRRETMIRR